MVALSHHFPFDPTYGYTLEELLAVEPPDPPPDFATFWEERYAEAMGIDPEPTLDRSRFALPRHEVLALGYRSTNGFCIRGWLLRPLQGPVNRAFILGHGYKELQRPDHHLPFADAVYLVPCFRGLGRSRRAPISPEPDWHILHDIDKPEGYILGGCVADVWTGVSALLELYPEVAGRIGYMGISFGGGVGALAMPWDTRLARVHLNIPSLGHQPLRLRLPTAGSAAALQRYRAEHGNVLAILCYYDAAIAARYMDRPVHVAAARFDPMVAPPGQFAIHNALGAERHLSVLDAGHFDYPQRPHQQQELMGELRTFFEPL